MQAKLSYEKIIQSALADHSIKDKFLVLLEQGNYE